MGLLSLAIWTPIAFGVLLLGLGRDDQAKTVRWFALLGSLVSLLVTLPRGQLGRSQLLFEGGREHRGGAAPGQGRTSPVKPRKLRKRIGISGIFIGRSSRKNPNEPSRWVAGPWAQLTRRGVL